MFNVIAENVYMYKINDSNGKFEIFNKNDANRIEKCRKGKNIRGFFMSEKRNFRCAAEPHDVYDGCVWFFEENEAWAKELLVEWYEHRKNKMREEYYELVMKSLKG